MYDTQPADYKERSNRILAFHGAGGKCTCFCDTLYVNVIFRLPAYIRERRKDRDKKNEKNRAVFILYLDDNIFSLSTLFYCDIIYKIKY